MEEIETITEDLPESVDHWMLACRMRGNSWCVSGTLRPSKEEVLSQDLPCWGNYDEYKLIRVALPIIVAKKEIIPKEKAPNPLQGTIEM